MNLSLWRSLQFCLLLVMISVCALQCIPVSQENLKQILHPKKQELWHINSAKTLCLLEEGEKMNIQQDG